MGHGCEGSASAARDRSSSAASSASRSCSTWARAVAASSLARVAAASADSASSRARSASTGASPRGAASASASCPAGGGQPVTDVPERGELHLQGGELLDHPRGGLDPLGQLLPVGRELIALLRAGPELPRELLDTLPNAVGRIERRACRLRRLLRRTEVLRGLRRAGDRALRRVCSLLAQRLELGEVGDRGRELLGALLRAPRLAPGGGPGVIDRADPEQAERHLLTLAGGHVGEGVELLLLGVDGRPEDAEVHVQQVLDLRIDVRDARRELEAADVQLGLGRRAPALQRAPDLVRLPAMLEDQVHLAVREDPVGTDLVLLRPRGVHAVQSERDRLHERGLAAAVLAEDADHAGRQLQIHDLELAVVAQGELADPHTVSPRASSRNRAPSATTRGRSRPERSCSST